MDKKKLNDNKLRMKKYILIVILIATCGIFFQSCNKQKYYYDTGLAKAKYDGNVLQYLQNNQYHMFDSLSKVIKLAGMEDVFENDSITFFAMADTAIKYSIEFLNSTLAMQGKDTISDLSQLSAAFWKEELSLYLFTGIHRLSDYPQIDFSNIVAYGGGYYKSYGGKVMNIGVVYNSVNNVQYQGYRQLYLNYFSGDVPPSVFIYTVPVASSDINPTNGIVHALQFTSQYFGFNPVDFTNEAIAIGLNN